jgi:cyclopropane-fatty-acyl-phospholipid synthase
VTLASPAALTTSGTTSTSRPNDAALLSLARHDRTHPPAGSSGPPRLVASVARRLAWAAGSGRAEGTIEVTDAGTSRRLGCGEPLARVTLHDQRAYAALLGSGSVGLGSSYVAGWWDSEDLTVLVRVLSRWARGLRTPLDNLARGLAPLLDIPARLRAPRPADDLRNVRAHYDLSNEFFELMLDETMTYSCAVFEDPATSLAEAQRAKIAQLCTKLELGPGDHLVEIGSGWGAQAIYAAEHHGCRVTTTTISEAQRSYVAKRVADAGLSHLVTVLGDDWRELRGQFDKLVSVEMIEAVDWRWHDRFLRTCAALLKQDGLAVVQAIVIDDRSFERAKHHQDFVRRMVFPGGCIPSVASIVSSLARATDLSVVGLEDIGRHYAQTLHLWAGNLEARAEAVEQLGVSEQLRRLWALYLAYCEASFLERHISDVQLVLAKPGWRGQLRAREARWHWPSGY